MGLSAQAGSHWRGNSAHFFICDLNFHWWADALRRAIGGPPPAETKVCHDHQVMSDYIGHSRHAAEQCLRARSRALKNG